MTPEAQRIAIAQACGWQRIRETPFGLFGCSPELDLSVLSDEYLCARPLPDYLNDLNALAEAVRGLSGHDMEIYANHLARLSYGKGTCGIEWHGRFSSLAVFDMLRASAETQAEALLRTLNLWTEE